MSYCKYLKQKLNKKIYCNKLKKEIKILECTNCKFKEYLIKSNLTKLKNKTSELAELERNRYSLFSSEKTKCYFCGSTYKLTWHEIFFGRNRRNSMKYGLCLRMCLKCHRKYQEDKNFNEVWHVRAQKKFNEVYPDLDFVEIFGKNYLD